MKIKILLAVMLFVAVNVFAQTPTFTSVSPSSATVNTVMTINGTNLSGITSVTLNSQFSGYGSINVNLLTVSPTQITFKIPDVAYFWNYPVYYCGGGGQTPLLDILANVSSISYYTGLTYKPLEGPLEILSISPGSGTINSNTIYTFNVKYGGTSNPPFFWLSGFGGPGVSFVRTSSTSLNQFSGYFNFNSFNNLNANFPCLISYLSGSACTPFSFYGPTIDITPQVSISSSTTTLPCTGTSSVIINSTISNIFPNAHTKQWKKNGVAISGATSNSLTITQAGTYTLEVNNAGCIATSNSINIQSAPTAITATATADGPTTFCSGNYVFLSATNVTGATYQWKKNGVNITSSGTSRTYKATATGSYTCLVTNACGSTTTNAIQVTTKTNAFATVSATGATSFCAGDSVTLNCTNLGSAYSVQWYRTNISMENDTAYSKVVKQPGTYKFVTKNIANGCSRICGSSVTVAVNCRMANPDAVAVEDENEEESKSIDEAQPKTIRLFPNPNSGSFTFEYQTTEEGTGELQILNVMGQSIYNSTVTVSGGIFQQHIELGDSFQKGIYVVRFMLNGVQHDRKLVLQ